MPPNYGNLSELKKEIDLSMGQLKSSTRNKTRSENMSQLVDDVRNLKSAVVSINRFLLAIPTDLKPTKPMQGYGVCEKHERLGTVTWERGDVPCPVCDRNKFIESQAKDVAEKMGIEKYPVWDAYFCLWDLPPVERKKRVDELGERFREASEKKKANQTENSNPSSSSWPNTQYNLEFIFRVERVKRPVFNDSHLMPEDQENSIPLLAIMLIATLVVGIVLVLLLAYFPNMPTPQSQSTFNNIELILRGTLALLGIGDIVGIAMKLIGSGEKSGGL
jgi:hypothetical protein